MKKPNIAVIGAGMAGISAAIELTGKAEISVFESTKAPGGRLRSFYSNDFGCTLDNGYHLMLGAYKQTIKLLNELGSANLLETHKLNIPYKNITEKNFSVYSSAKLPDFAHLFPSLLRLPGLNLFSMLKMAKIFFQDEDLLSNITCTEYLERLGQSGLIVKYFWEPFIKAVLNLTPEKAAAVNLHNVLRKALLSGPEKSSLLIPTAPFSEIIQKPAEIYFKKKGIRFHRGTAITSVFRKNGGNIFLTGKEKTFGPFDALITAVDVFSLKKLFPMFTADIPYTPITSTYFRIEGDMLPQKPITGLPESVLQWLFYLPHSQIYATSSSAIDLRLSAVDIEKELKRFFPGERKIINFKCIRVKRATPAFTVNSEKERKQNISDREIFFAGDWTATGLPGTIEGAVVSGINAAHSVLKIFKLS